MFPWNQNLLLYSKAVKHQPGATALHTYHRSGFVDLVQPVHKPDTSSSKNPLLIVQVTGKPTSTTERLVK